MGESVEGGRSRNSSPRGGGVVEQVDGANSKVDMDLIDDGARGKRRRKEDMDSKE